MEEHEALANQFEANRTHLKAVAYRMLGSISEADDAVQEAWLRLSRSGSAGVENLNAWLTTVVARVCLDMLRSRKSRREEPLGVHLTDPIANPEHEAMLADSVGLALLVVLETLAPAERLAFVLHDMFAMPFDEIAPIVKRSPAAARQLASRARRRVQGASATPDIDRNHQRKVVDAFLAASRGGDFDALLALLDPNVVLRADPAAVRMGSAAEVLGAAEVAATFSGRARTAQPALVNGAAGAVWAPGGRPRVVFAFTIADGKIVQIEMLADPARLSELDLSILQKTRVKRILIVEDDRDLRFVVRMVLERAGYEVVEAGDGLAALNSIRAGPPDLIIADLTMPVMSGVELVDRVRSNPATVSIPMILLSGGQVDSTVWQRVDAVVMKPFEPDDLVAKILRALQADRGEVVT